MRMSWYSHSFHVTMGISFNFLVNPMNCVWNEYILYKINKYMVH